MPLESLRQPFNPDEPGRKLREVQVEHEPEREETARENYEHVKEKFYVQSHWAARMQEGRKPAGDIGVLISAQLSFVEQKLGVESTVDENLAQELESANELVLARPDRALHFLNKDPKKARSLWRNTMDTFYLYDEEDARYVSKSPERVPRPDKFLNLRLFFVESYFNPSEARKKLEAMKKKTGFNESKTRWVDFGRDQTSYELLTVLIESSYDIDLAYAHFQDLKSSELYNTEQGLWQWAYSSEGKGKYTLSDQLNAILIERQFEIAGKLKPPAQKHLQIPEERNF